MADSFQGLPKDDGAIAGLLTQQLLQRLRKSSAIADTSPLDRRPDGGETAPLFQEFSRFQVLLGVQTSPYGETGIGDLPSGAFGAYDDFEDFADRFLPIIRNLVGAIPSTFIFTENADAQMPDVFIDGSPGVIIAGHIIEAGFDLTGTEYFSETAIENELFLNFKQYMAPYIYEYFLIARYPEVLESDSHDLVAAILTAFLDASIVDWPSGGPPQRVNFSSSQVTRPVNGYAVQELMSAAFWLARRGEILSRLSDLEIRVDGRGFDLTDHLPVQYPFPVALAGQVNFGLQAVYRQDWYPIGVYPGEIVRTLPLAPQQIEKLTFKAIRRSKRVRRLQHTTSIETVSERSLGRTSASEVIEEATDSSNWHTEVNASISIPAAGGFGGGGGITAGAGGAAASLSRETKTAATESMEKATSRIRRDTVLSVEIEQEDTFERSVTSEIRNPNDELPVTYVYSRLRQYYETVTYFSELNTVILVAERIPPPRALVGSWILRHRLAIDEVLLDETLRPDLDAIHQEAMNDGYGYEDIDGRIDGLMGSLSTGLPDHSDVRGTLPDIYQAPQQAYERELERWRARQRRSSAYRQAVRRVSRHVYDNILHYCRRIWAREDPDQRMARYSRIRVPINWEFIVSAAEDEVVRGHWAPSVVDEQTDTVPLSDLIGPEGPIGFHLNYAVFHIAESAWRRGLARMLQQARAPYLAARLSVQTIAGPEIVLRHWSLHPNRLDPGAYVLKRTDGAEVAFEIFQHQGLADWVLLDKRRLDADGTLRIHGLRFRFVDPGRIPPGAAIRVELSFDRTLEDPDLKELRWREPPPAPADEPRASCPAMIAEAASCFPDVAHALALQESSPTGWDKLDEPARQALRARYHDLLLRRRDTGSLAIDTDNVLLHQDVAESALLEPLRQVAKTVEQLERIWDLKRQDAELDRYRDRLAKGLLGDPEIDRVSIVVSPEGGAALGLTDVVANGDANLSGGSGSSGAPGNS